MPSNKEMPSDLFDQMNFSMEIPSLFEAATTETPQPPMTRDLLNGETKQTSSVGQDLAQSLVSTTTATDSHDPISNDCPGESDKSSSVDMKLDGSSQSGVDDEKKIDCSNRMICHKNVSISNKEMPSDLFSPMNFSLEIPSLFKAVTTETPQPPTTSDLLNGKSQTTAVKPNSLKLKRYADLFKSDKQEVISVPDKTSPESVHQSSFDTKSATVENDPVIGDSTGNVKIPSSNNLKLGSSSHLDDTKDGFSHQILSQQGSETDEKEKEQSPLKPRLWFEDSSKMFNAVDSSLPASSQAISVEPNSLKKRFDDIFKSGIQEYISIQSTLAQYGLDISITPDSSDNEDSDNGEVEMDDPTEMTMKPQQLLELAYEKRRKLSERDGENLRCELFQNRLIATLSKHIEKAKKIVTFDRYPTVHTAKPSSLVPAQEFEEPAPKRFKAAN